ncbi:error-prone DNA polymerase [Pusillimonas sp. CC-YST705]|uniref:Error-prone DNA polymerase n=1 Tax=Mesopusillimonas faecipullorum TaxID=2755040 RepID=A0ABS8CFJ5_9BURK|nr:error-prone DNA polymerase [Mesopusillimonas faecipullorum]MCB5364811.1 error-prone DNA polymerase [Mesopusillimonas faecipullorum]
MVYSVNNPAPPVSEYAELYCQSNYSFLRGASHPEELVEHAASLGYRALALTDECSMAGIVRAHVAAREHGIRLLIGTHCTLLDKQGEPACTLVLLAQTRQGYAQLCEWITLGRSRAEKGDYRLYLSDLSTPPEPYTHLQGLPECLALLDTNEHFSEDTGRHLQMLAKVFANRAWIALHQGLDGLDEQRQVIAEHAARLCGLPIVAVGKVLMHKRARKPLHDILTAVRVRQPVAACGQQRMINAERHLRPLERLATLHDPQHLAQTLSIAQRCTFRLDEIRYEYPDEICPKGLSPTAYLRQETLLGAQRRYGASVPASVQQQLKHELQLISELNYEAYFLTVYDIVGFARRQGILCQGRGSAANSAVCYCLGITEVDPSQGNSLFERFISKERNEPPDIDVDFEHQRREEVIQYIYEKYGRHRAALTAVVISYRTRSALRDVGRALGMDEALVEHVTKSYRRWQGHESLLEHLQLCGLDAQAPTTRHWAVLASQLIGFPRHLSQHPGGFVISRGPLSQLVPIENAAMPGRSVVQWDKDDLDALGLLKVDILALGMLSVIRRALAFVSQRQGRPFSMQDIPRDDVTTFDMICRADTIGTFQIESRAQMSMLPRLQPRCYYDLVIQVAIVRPGPIQGGMVHPYLRRRQEREKVTYPSPAVKQALQRTLGVPIFQEQVMQIAILAAGFTPGQADALRRSMAAWRRKGGLESFRNPLIEGMVSRGYERGFAEQIFRQAQGFGEYGFPESHAASFALLAYISSWIKCHEPAAFLAALLNSQPMGFYSPSTLVQDARRHGVCVLPVDIMHSTWKAQLEDHAVRLGFNQVKGLAQPIAQRITQARMQAPFLNLADLARRAALDKSALETLARADALRQLAGGRRAAQWHAGAHAPSADLLREADTPNHETPALPLLAESQATLQDYRSLGLTLGRHPLSMLRNTLGKQGFLSSEQLRHHRNRFEARSAGLVTVRQRPGTAKGVVFVTLEDEYGSVNLIVPPTLALQQYAVLIHAQLLGARGIWQVQGQVRHLHARQLFDLSPLLGQLSIGSRDFH